MTPTPRDLMVARAVLAEVGTVTFDLDDLARWLKPLPEPADRVVAESMQHGNIDVATVLAYEAGEAAERARAGRYIRNRAGIANDTIAPVLEELADRIERADYRRKEDGNG